MSAVTFSDMPQEILDEIVDHGADDKVDMRNCALVCRSLRSRPQKHIYDDIRIATTERIVQLMKLIQENTLIANYLETVVVSSKQFIPVHGVNTALASLFLLVRKLAPRTSIRMAVIAGTSDTPDHHPQFTHHIPQELLLYSLSLVTRLWLDNVTAFPAEALFNFRRLEYLTYNNTTTRPDYSIMFTPHIPSSIPPFFFRSITRFKIINIKDFPAILISNCHALTHLTINNTTFKIAEGSTASSRPQITHLHLAKFNLETIKMLVNMIVDLSRLQLVWDETDWDYYVNPTSEIYRNLNLCYQHLLSDCRNSMTSLIILCSAYFQSVYERKQKRTIKKYFPQQSTTMRALHKYFRTPYLISLT